MPKTPIFPKGSPPPLAPYSPGVRAGDTIYVSGVLSLDKDGNAVELATLVPKPARY